MTPLKFIIFCMPRTGSTLLIEALKTHPQLKITGELFNVSNYEDKYIRKEIIKKFLNKEEKQLIIEKKETFKEILFETKKIDYKEFLNEIFKNFNGFKIISNQIYIESNIWDYLEKEKVKFILLERDIKECCNSFHTAMINKKWHYLNKEKINNYNYKCSKQQINNFSEYYEKYYKIIKNRITKNSENIIINYKDLDKQWIKTIKKIEFFLQIEESDVQQKLKKIFNNHKIYL